MRELIFDIRRAGFSRRGSMLTLVDETLPEQPAPAVHAVTLSRGLSNYGGTNPFLKNTIQLAFRPVGTDDFTNCATPGKLTLTCAAGQTEVCFDGPDCLRFRSSVPLQFWLYRADVTQFSPEGDGVWTVGYQRAGLFRFVPLEGAALDPAPFYASDGTQTWVPFTVAAGSFALCVDWPGAQLPAAFAPFDDCAAASQADWEDWSRKYPEVPAEFTPLRDLATYCIWQSCIADRGIVRDEFVFFVKLRYCGGLCWQQGYHAIALMHDLDKAVDLLAGVYQFQDPWGQLPDSINDMHAQYSVTKPPFEGYILLKLMERWGDRFTTAHAARLYPLLEKWIGWWMTCRDSDRDGVPQFNNGCESGIDKNGGLGGGIPAEGADLLTYCIFFAEAMAKLAEKLDRPADAARWNAQAQTWLETLMTEFWNGRNFIARVSGTHKEVEFDELEAFLPLILGKRLPDEVFEKLLPRLKDPEAYYTPYGFRTYPKSWDGDRPIPGFIENFNQFKFFPLLIEIGEADFAKAPLEGFLRRCCELYPNFGFMEFHDPAHIRGGAATVCPGTHITSLGSAIFLYLAWLYGTTYLGMEDGL